MVTSVQVWDNAVGAFVFVSYILSALVLKLLVVSDLVLAHDHQTNASRLHDGNSKESTVLKKQKSDAILHIMVP